MRDNMFKSRMGGAFQTMDTIGTTPCASDDEKIREGAHCSDLGAKQAQKPTSKATAPKASKTGSKCGGSRDEAETIGEYEMSLGGETDMIPIENIVGSRGCGSKGTTSGKSDTKSSTAKNGTKKSDNDGYVLVDEVIIVTEE